MTIGGKIIEKRLANFINGFHGDGSWLFKEIVSSVGKGTVLKTCERPVQKPCRMLETKNAVFVLAKTAPFKSRAGGLGTPALFERARQSRPRRVPGSYFCDSGKISAPPSSSSVPPEGSSCMSSAIRPDSLRIASSMASAASWCSFM